MLIDKFNKLHTNYRKYHKKLSKVKKNFYKKAKKRIWNYKNMRVYKFTAAKLPKLVKKLIKSLNNSRIIWIINEFMGTFMEFIILR